MPYPPQGTAVVLHNRKLRSPSKNMQPEPQFPSQRHGRFPVLVGLFFEKDTPKKGPAIHRNSHIAGTSILQQTPQPGTGYDGRVANPFKLEFWIPLLPGILRITYWILLLTRILCSVEPCWVGSCRSSLTLSGAVTKAYVW